MKKLYLSVLIILVPVIVYCVFFFANDPYGYFKSNGSSQSTSNLTGKMLDYRNGEYDAVIIGDSRIASYDVSELSASSGYKFSNMAYRGCMTEEMVGLLQWCIDNQNAQLKEVVIVTSFYNMNTLLQQDRVASTKKVIESPFSYAFNTENAMAMLDNLKSGKKTDQTEQSKEVTAEQKKEHFNISKDAMEYYLKGYTYDKNVIEGLCNICDICAQNGIKVKIILPPWWEGYYELLEQWQLTDILDDYKKTLSEHAEVYDFEYKDCALSANYDDYSDYSHFKGTTFQTFIKSITESDKQNCRFWSEGSVK